MKDRIHWENTLDASYACRVVEKAPTYGELYLKNLETESSQFIGLVPISKYFKTQDVLSWGEKCIRVLDSK